LKFTIFSQKNHIFITNVFYTGNVHYDDKEIAVKREKIKSKKQLSKGRVFLTIIMPVILLAAGGIGILFLLRNTEQSQSQPDFAGSGFPSFNGFGEADMVTASGVVGVGMTQELFGIQDLDTTLLIEEVIVSANTQVQAQDMILKVSQESFAAAQQELKDDLEEAELASRSGAIAYAQSLITLAYDRDMAVLKGEQAQAVYEAAVADVHKGEEEAQEALDQVREDIAAGQAALDGDTYYDDYKVGTYKAIYDENLKIIEDKLEEWGIAWSQITGGAGGGNQSSRGSVSGGDLNYSYYVSSLTAMYQVLEQNLRDYESAQEAYEDAKVNGALQLEQQKLSISALETTLTQAKENGKKQLLNAQLTKETSLASAAQAQAVYETEVEKALSDYDALEDAWQDAKDNLALWESSMVDGYYLASADGTILRTMVREGQELSSDGVIFLYSIPDQITVTVSVDQGDVAKIAIGDAAYVQSTDGMLEGTVTQVHPITDSNSRTSVTYDVTVKVPGDSATLSANQSVTVWIEA
jgi:multidrug resistance efflux pump